MPHHEPRLYAKSGPKFDAVKKLLDENDQLLGQNGYTAAQNTNAILRYIVEAVHRCESDLIQMHAKIQPILKSIGDGSDWRNTPIWRDRDE